MNPTIKFMAEISEAEITFLDTYSTYIGGRGERFKNREEGIHSRRERFTKALPCFHTERGYL